MADDDTGRVLEHFHALGRSDAQADARHGLLITKNDAGIMQQASHALIGSRHRTLEEGVRQAALSAYFRGYKEINGEVEDYDGD